MASVRTVFKAVDLKITKELAITGGTLSLNGNIKSLGLNQNVY